MPPPWWLHPPTEPPMATNDDDSAELSSSQQQLQQPGDYPPHAWSESEQLQQPPSQPMMDEYPMQYQASQTPLDAYYGYPMHYLSPQTQPTVDAAYGYPMQYHTDYPPLHEVQIEGDGEDDYPQQPLFMNGSYRGLFDSTFQIPPPPPWWSSSQPQLVDNDDLLEQEAPGNGYSVRDDNWSRNGESYSSLMAEVSSNSAKEEVDGLQLAAPQVAAARNT